MYGPLYQFSAYRFENYLRFFKNIVRAKHHVLQQIRNRLAEQGNLKTRTKQPDGIQDHSYLRHVDDVAEFSTYKANDTLYKADQVNCYAKIVVNENSVQTKMVKILKFKRLQDSSSFFEYKEINEIGPLFTFEDMDLDSRDFGIYVCDPTEMEEIHTAPLNYIIHKLICSPLCLGERCSVESCSHNRVMQKMTHSSDPTSD